VASAKVIKSWDETSYATAPHPAGFVKIVQACLAYQSESAAEEVMQEAAQEFLEGVARGLAHLITTLKGMPGLDP